MSYILDALRRADAERSLGEVPTLHAPTAPWLDEPGGRSDDRGEGRPSRRAGWLAAGGLLVLIALAAAVWALRPQAAQPTPGSPAQGALAAASASATASQPQPQQLSPVAQPAPLSVPAPAPDPGVAAAASGAAVAARPAARPTLPAGVGDARPRPPREAPAPRAAAPTTRFASSEAPRAAGGRAAPGARPESPEPADPGAAAVSAERLPRLEDLPPDVRTRLPPLAVSGAVHSADPANRMLILNGQLVREGDALGQDLVLVRIDRRAAVLEQRGQRFTIGY